MKTFIKENLHTIIAFGVIAALFVAVAVGAILFNTVTPADMLLA